MTDLLRDAVLDGAPLRDVSVVDAHAHLGSYGRFFIPDPTEATMVRLMDRCGVSQAVISSCLAFAHDAKAGNDATAQALEAYPKRFLGYVVVNPHQAIESELSRFYGHPGMVGVKLHPEVHQYPLTGPAYEAVWDHADRTRQPVLIHTSSDSRFNNLEQLARIASEHPAVRLIAGHAGGSRVGFAQAIGVAGQYPNIYLEICGSFATCRWIERMVTALGADRVLYGSDFPFIDLRYSIGRVVFAELELEDRLAVLGGSMRRLLTPASEAGFGELWRAGGCGHN